MPTSRCPVPSPGSCSRCNRPLPVGSDSRLCPECLRTAGTAGSTPASAARHPHTPATPPAPGDPATRSMGRPPAVAPAGHPFAAQFQSTPTEADRTRTPKPGADTGGFQIGARDYLPEAPPGYDLIRPLGSGGWCTVYLAREHAAERAVAIKFLHAPTSQIAFDRFLVEARSLARLDHPNIVRVFAVETHWREPFLTMEYAAGGTLADLAQPGGPLPDPADAARLMIPVAEAVAAAHAAGILHRDLKPSNILLAGKSESRNPKSEKEDTPRVLSDFGFRLSDFSPKVSDFGLAKRTDRDDGLTRTGPLGTPSYMSPEAAAGRFRDIGPASDVYGLGATLYHLLTGRPPFTGENGDQIIRKVLTEPPDRLRAIRPEIPAELEAVAVKALEKDPAARYPTAADLAADLRRFLAGQVPAAPVLSRRRRVQRWLGRNRRRIAVAVGVVLLAVVLVAAGRQLRPDPPPPEQVIRAEIAAGKPVRLLAADGRPRWASWPLGPAALKATADDGGTCNFESRDPHVPQVLLLLDDPGVDSYRVRAEIRQKLKAGSVIPGFTPDDNQVGLVLGYAGQDRPDGTRVHCLMALKFTEYDPPGRPQVKRWLELMDVGSANPPGFAPPSLYTKRLVDAAPLDPTPDRPTWRWVEAVVTPAGVWVPGPNRVPQLAAAAGIAARRTSIEREIAAGPAGPIDPFPDWSPRMPVGIWACGSWVYVRNVTIEAIK